MVSGSYRCYPRCGYVLDQFLATAVDEIVLKWAFQYHHWIFVNAALPDSSGRDDRRITPLGSDAGTTLPCGNMRRRRRDGFDIAGDDSSPRPFCGSCINRGSGSVQSATY